MVKNFVLYTAMCRDPKYFKPLQYTYNSSIEAMLGKESIVE